MTKGKPKDGSKNPGGKPKKFTDVEILQEKIDDYFKSITIDRPRTTDVIVGYEDEEKKKPIIETRPVLNNAGNQVIDTVYFENPSIISMAHHIGITRAGLINYEKDEKYFATIKKAKEKIERYLEGELYRSQGQVAGIVFNLKNNFGWTDKQEMDLSVKEMPKIVLKRSGE